MFASFLWVVWKAVGARCTSRQTGWINVPMPLFFFLLSCATSFASPPPTSILIGALFPIHKQVGVTFVEDSDGRRRMAAALLALDHVNNKSDGFWDNLLPETTLNMSMMDSRRSESAAVINGFRLWESARASVILGPASSGPSMRAQQIFSVKQINLPQIAYSATSPQLSNSKLYSRFARTPPSDAAQMGVLINVLKHFKWSRVCTLAGSDSYSKTGIETFHQNCKENNVTLLNTVTFASGTTDMTNGIRSLINSDCLVVVVWSQASDMITVGNTALREGFTAAGEGIQWISSEVFSSSFNEICGGDKRSMCNKVFKGCLLVSPNFQGTNMNVHGRFVDAWHAQPDRVNSKDRLSINGCDKRTDASGNYYWIRDDDQDETTPNVCSAVKFSDYNHNDAASRLAETSGDGRVSPYTTWSYDAFITIAHALHAMVSDSNAAGPNEQPNWGDQLWEKVLETQFDGFSGKVSFDSNGDRNVLDTPYFFWNFKGEQSAGGFDKIGICHMLRSSRDSTGTGTAEPRVKLDNGLKIVWPQGDIPSTAQRKDSANTVRNIKVMRPTATSLNISWSWEFTNQEKFITISWYQSASLREDTKLGSQILFEKTSFLVEELPQSMIPTRAVTYFKIVVGQSASSKFATSDGWVTTSTCPTSDSYLNDTNYEGDLETDVTLFACRQCPENAYCPGGYDNTWYNVYARFGSWRNNQLNKGPSNFTECLAPQMCLGAANKQLEGLFIDPETEVDLATVNSNESCLGNAYGPLCGVCGKDYYRDSSFVCNECPSDVESMLFALLVFLLVLSGMIFAVYYTVKDEDAQTSVDIQIIKIMVNHLVISSSTSRLPLRWEPWLQDFFRISELLSFNIGDTVGISITCMSKENAWLDIIILAAISPIVLLLFHMLIFLPFQNFWKVRFRIKNILVMKVSLMVCLLLIHPSITKVTASMFSCREIADKWYLNNDFSVDCADATLVLVKYLVGLPMLFLYVLGVPGFYFTRLYRHRNRLSNIRWKYGFLLTGFKENRYFWELYNTLRKAVFMTMLTIFSPLGIRINSKYFQKFIFIWMNKKNS
jgi:ABC-type branched-subunit amino acid transport system substrate-binding protein